jgi:hypothetical protein
MPAHQQPRTPQIKKNNAKHPAKSAIPGTPGVKKVPAISTPLPLTPGKPLLDYQQIQKDELEVLKSVFMDDYEHVEKHGAWNVSIHILLLYLMLPVLPSFPRLPVFYACEINYCTYC